MKSKIISIIICTVCCTALSNNLFAQTEQEQTAVTPDSIGNGESIPATADTIEDNALPQYAPLRTDIPAINEDSLAAVFAQRRAEEETLEDDYFASFNPIPAKAVWYAALIPGGGQIYNRKYWKLPIIYGGYLGLIYGFQWNQRYYRTYSNAYRDLMLNSPNASYKDFLPPNYNVEARRDYLERVFKRKKNSYRNYRDYCVVGMLALYLVSMVDAYVDASLYHFDVSPELDACNNPALTVGYTVEF